MEAADIIEEHAFIKRPIWLGHHLEQLGYGHQANKCLFNARHSGKRNALRNEKVNLICMELPHMQAVQIVGTKTAGANLSNETNVFY